jgi:hypothetical protein
MHFMRQIVDGDFGYATHLRQNFHATPPEPAKIFSFFAKKSIRNQVP